MVKFLEHVCSFTFGTRVTTDHGEQQIGTLRVGERVLAYNPRTHKMEYEPILHVWIHADNDLVDLTIAMTTKGQHGKAVTLTSEVVHTTQKHPFLTSEQGFLPVREIKLGMHILRADGRMGVVTRWKMVSGIQIMYNLEVAQDHTYTVGDGQWVVHNSGCSDARALARAILKTLNKRLVAKGLPTTERTVVAVGFLEDGSGLVALNEREGEFALDPVAQELITLLDEGSSYAGQYKYVGPITLMPKGFTWRHAEEFILDSAAIDGLSGLGASKQMCIWCILVTLLKQEGGGPTFSDLNQYP